MTRETLGLVFSRDRALQLDATLRSFQRHVADTRAAELVVLYRATSERHAAQYRELGAAFAGRPGLRFVAERAFRADVLRILARGLALPPARRWTLERLPTRGPRRLPLRLARALLGDAPDRPVLFLVDDNLFVRPFDLAEAGGLLGGRPDALGVSLRLGCNTRHCYVLDRPQAPPAFQAAGVGWVAYDWTTGEHDFGYPLELSSSLYRSRDLLPLLATLPFANPNQMEARLAECAPHFRARRPTLLCYERSVTFCNPVNRVQEEYPNRAGERFAQPAERLADLYQAGRRVDVGHYDGFVPEACHQEVELVLRSRAGGAEDDGTGGGRSDQPSPAS